MAKKEERPGAKILTVLGPGWSLRNVNAARMLAALEPGEPVYWGATVMTCANNRDATDLVLYAMMEARAGAFEEAAVEIEGMSELWNNNTLANVIRAIAAKPKETGDA